MILEQIEEFKTEETGIGERKLVVYRVGPKGYSSGLEAVAKEKQDDPSIYQQLKRSKHEFEVLLIGLDGGIKLRQEEILTTEKLFGMIDRMPMRMQEMRRE